jgi:hypothetical protein
MSDAAGGPAQPQSPAPAPQGAPPVPQPHPAAGAPVQSSQTAAQPAPSQPAQAPSPQPTAPQPQAAAPGPAGPATPPPSTPSGPPPSDGPPPPERENLVDAIADLLQMLVNWLRQEAAGIMRDKVVLPGQQLGMLIAFALAAAILLVIGLCFLFVAFLMVLARFIGWPGAFALVGVVILIVAGVLSYLKVRSIQQ